MYSGNMSFSFCIYLMGHEFKILTKTTSGFNTSVQNDSADISYKPSNRQQAKVQILTLLCSIWELFTFKMLQNESVRKMTQQL